jgi:magnesium transporter
MAEKILYKKVGESTFTTIDKPKKGAWVCYVNPSPAELETACDLYGLDFSIVSDALDPFEAPRVEIEEGVKYIFVRFPTKKNENLDTETALVVITDDYFLSFSRSEVPVMKHFESIDINTTQKTKMFIEYLAAINGEFSRQIQSISKQIRAASANIEKIENRQIARFVEFERVLNDFLSGLIPMNLVFERILYGKLLKLYEQDEDLVQDLNLSTEQLIESCKANMRHLVNIREAYSTILSNNLNRTMKILTSVTVLLTIPTIIFSFFGMNVDLPLDDSRWASAEIILMTVLLMLILVFVFLRGRLLK